MTYYVYKYIYTIYIIIYLKKKKECMAVEKGVFRFIFRGLETLNGHTLRGVYGYYKNKNK